MATAAAANPVEGENPQQVQADHFIHSIFRGLLIFCFFQVFSQQLGKTPQPPPQQQQQTESPLVTTTTTASEKKIKPLGVTSPLSPSSSHRSKLSCIWDPSTTMDLRVYITDLKEMDPLNDCLKFRNTKNLLTEWHESNLVLFQPTQKKTNIDGGSRQLNITIPIPKSVQHNNTHIYAHVCLLRQTKQQQQQNSQRMEEDDVLFQTIPLTKHKRRKRIRNEKNLLESNIDENAPTTANTTAIKITKDTSPLTVASNNSTHDQTLLYLKPSLTLQIVDPHSMPHFPQRSSIPQQMSKHMQWQKNETTSHLYYPILYSSEFWITTDRLMEVNDTITESPIALEFQLESIQMWKWQFMAQMEDSWQTQANINGDDDSGTDMLRTMFLETNPYLLGITAIVSVLHTIFDILAFKNDINFFKGKKSMIGLSVRSMIINTACQLIIFLYLMDNETSFMVLMSNGVGILIEIWKITKALNISFRAGGAGGFQLKWEESKAYKESKTKEYDEIATDHLLFITMPLVSGYGIYSLLHQKHKGWYSWILNTLVGFIYMFGFVMMTPQLFINYKLQSVAHLNWRTLTYKSINTFIDDLFAFVIKMPIMHRLACLRDDVIFLIFCYQRYKYRTDYTRVNEFGQCEQPTEEMLIEKRVEEDEKLQKQKGEEDHQNNTALKRRGAKEKRI